VRIWYAAYITFLLEQWKNFQVQPNLLKKENVSRLSKFSTSKVLMGWVWFESW
jgi:hypothetical protein